MWYLRTKNRSMLLTFASGRPQSRSPSSTRRTFSRQQQLQDQTDPGRSIYQKGILHIRLRQRDTTAVRFSTTETLPVAASGMKTFTAPTTMTANAGAKNVRKKNGSGTSNKSSKSPAKKSLSRRLLQTHGIKDWPVHQVLRQEAFSTQGLIAVRQVVRDRRRATLTRITCTAGLLHLSVTDPGHTPNSKKSQCHLERTRGWITEDKWIAEGLFRPPLLRWTTVTTLETNSTRTISFLLSRVTTSWKPKTFFNRHTTNSSWWLLRLSNTINTNTSSIIISNNNSSSSHTTVRIEWIPTNSAERFCQCKVISEADNQTAPIFRSTIPSWPRGNSTWRWTDPHRFYPLKMSSRKNQTRVTSKSRRCRRTKSWMLFKRRSKKSKRRMTTIEKRSILTNSVRRSCGTFCNVTRRCRCRQRLRRSRRTGTSLQRRQIPTCPPLTKQTFPKSTKDWKPSNRRRDFTTTSVANSPTRHLQAASITGSITTNQFPFPVLTLQNGIRCWRSWGTKIWDLITTTKKENISEII